MWVFMVIPRFGTQAALADFVFAHSVWSPAIMFANLGFRGVLSSDVRTEYHFGEYFGLRLIALGFSTVVITAVATALGWRGAALATVAVIGLYKLLDSLGELFVGLFQKYELMSWIAGSVALTAGLGGAGFAGMMAATRGIVWSVVTMAIAEAVVLVLYVVPRGTRAIAERGDGASSGWRPVFPVGRLARLAWLSLPVGVTAMLVSLSVNIPRYFVRGFMDDASLGQFGTMGYVVVAATLVMSAVCNSFLPRLSREYALGEAAAFRASVTRFAALGASLGATCVVGAAMFGRRALEAAFHAEFRDAETAFTILMLGGAVTFVGYTLQFTLTAARRFAVQMPIIALDVLATIAACALLVPSFGLAGAAGSTVVGAVVRVVALSVALRSAVRALPAVGTARHSRAAP